MFDILANTILSDGIEKNRFETKGEDGEKCRAYEIVYKDCSYIVMFDRMKRCTAIIRG